MKQIAQGAEAKLFRAGGVLVKSRIPKGYRVKELDEELRKLRTRREAKVLEKAKALGLLVPKLVSADDKAMELRMEYVSGQRLSECLCEQNLSPLCRQIGRLLATLHQNDIIHGDLTTSNLILKGKKLYVIDFGLSVHSKKLEDKAVELHVLKEALESKHHEVWKAGFRLVLNEYEKHYPVAKEVIRRLEKVEGRGRYKH
jgi:TP53 regulating kinase and related kinases